MKKRIQANPYEFEFDTETTALLVIDMQRDFCEEGGFGELLGNDISEVRKIIPAVGQVISYCRKNQIPVIYTKEGHLPDLSDCPVSKLKRSKRQGAGIGDDGPMGRIMIRGEKGNDIVPELTPLPGDGMIYKCGKGSFYHTDLQEQLKERGIQTLLVTGVTTHVCVQTTIREANDRGYECLLIEDASAAYDRKDHLDSIRMITQQGAIFGWSTGSAQLFQEDYDGTEEYSFIQMNIS